MSVDQASISLNSQYDMPFVYRLVNRPAIADRRFLWQRFKKALLSRDTLAAFIPHEIHRPETLVEYPCFDRSGYSQAMLQIMAL